MSTDLTWDGTSGLINGDFTGQINNTLTPKTAVTQQTGITTSQQVQFVASVTFGAAVGTGGVQITEFVFENI